jgi:hypothetical protein
MTDFYQWKIKAPRHGTTDFYQWKIKEDTSLEGGPPMT